MIKRTIEISRESVHLAVHLAPLRFVGDLSRFGTGDRPTLFDAHKVFVAPVAAFDRPARTAFQHLRLEKAPGCERAHIRFAGLVFPSTPEPESRNAL